jgi:EmrB/QacA subfamily drug resistance transporter
MNALALLVAGAFFMEFLDGSIIATALPHMAQSLGGTAVGLHVGISAYLLTVAVFILPGGWIAERYGARPVFTSAILVFTAGSVLCGFAVSVETFVAARVLQGIGGAMMVPVGRLIVLRTTEKANLLRAMAMLTWPALTAPLLGPPVGGFISDNFTWRWIFFINLPLGLIGYLFAWRLVPRIDGAGKRPFDMRGFLLGSVLLASTTAGLDQLGEGAQDWTQIGVLSAVAVVSLGLFVRHIHRVKHPLVQPSTFQFASFRRVMTGGTVMRVMINAMPFLLPLCFQLGFGLDAFNAGLLVLALFCGNIGIKPLTSMILRRFGFRRVLLVNGALQAVTMAACALLQPDTPIAVIIVLLAISGASRSMQFTSLVTLAFADVPQTEMGSANTLFSVSMQLALGIGVAVGAVLLNLGALLLGSSGVPSLAVFHASFIGLAVLMAISTLDSLWLDPKAGDVVARR